MPDTEHVPAVAPAPFDLSAQTAGPFLVIETRARGQACVAQGDNALSLWELYKQGLTYDYVVSNKIHEVWLLDNDHQLLMKMMLSPAPIQRS